MEKIRDDQVCEIVADLLPSYLEGECSEASRKLVEAHLEECVRCRDLAKAMQADFACMKEENDRREKDDQREIDALRRVKRRSRIRTAVIAVVVAVCMAFGAVAVYSLIGTDFPSEIGRPDRRRSGCFRSGGRMERRPS